MLEAIESRDVKLVSLGGQISNTVPLEGPVVTVK